MVLNLLWCSGWELWCCEIVHCINNKITNYAIFYLLPLYISTYPTLTMLLVRVASMAVSCSSLAVWLYAILFVCMVYECICLP